MGRRGPVRVVRWKVRPDGWPSGLGLRIVMVADVHAVWPWMTAKRLGAIVDQANGLDADLICLMGDYPGHLMLTRPVPVEAVTAELARLSAPLGVWAIFGNHDWRDDAEATLARRGPTLWHRAFDEAGLNWLENASVQIEAPGGTIALAGLGSQQAFKPPGQAIGDGVDDMETTLVGIADGVPVILLAHEPDVFPDVPEQVGLTLSGHTHGGQIAPFGKALFVPSRFGTRYAYGHHRLDGRDLVVSGGLGCSGVPFRVGRPPELTVVDVG